MVDAVQEDKVVVLEETTNDSVINDAPYAKQRKQLAIAFVLCGFFLVSLVVFAFVSLPKYKASADIEHLQKAYDAIREIDYYIEAQSQGGRLNESVLKDKIEIVTSSLADVEGRDAREVKTVWLGFKEQLSGQNATFAVINDAIQLRLRVDRSSTSLQQTLITLALQFSESRAVSIETVRYIDQLSNSIVRLHANILNIISSQSQVDIKTISALTESLAGVQKGLNTLLVGSPADAVQSIKGFLEEESLIEAQFVFNQLAKDGTSLVQDARGIVFLNQMRTQLQTEKDTIQRLLQSSIESAYTSQQNYIETINQMVFRLSLMASIAAVLFFTLFAFLFLRLNKSRLSIEFEKNVKTQRVDDVLRVVDDFVLLKSRLLPQLEIFSALNNESDRILQKGREVKESSKTMNSLLKETEHTYDYLEQALSHDISLIRNNSEISLDDLKSTLRKQLEFFKERRKVVADFKHTAVIVDGFFSNVVSNVNDSIIAYREVEQGLMFMISEIDQLDRSLKE